MRRQRPVIALVTDFGLHDHYVGAMKGVMLGRCPDAQMVDITHEIDPQDVQGGALALEASFRDFPPGTVFLVVVDPGVGTSRRAVALENHGYAFVGPDNGVLSAALAGGEMCTAVELTDPRYQRSAVSRTFEGRDRFAPAAAAIASGVEVADLGRAVPASRLTKWTMASPVREGESWRGEVVAVDRFGNLITNIVREDLAGMASVQVWLDALLIGPLVETYADASAMSPCALVGSSGRLEIAVRGGSASRALNARRGTSVRVTSV